MERTYTVGSGNVFLDAGFPEEEAENLRIRAWLMMEIEKSIKEMGFTQKQAAERTGVAQPRISDLVRGKIGLFSIDALIEIATKLGLKVTLSVEAA